MMTHAIREMGVDDVLSIPRRDLPLIVLTDNMRSYVSRRIKRHTRGDYNHAMVMARCGFVVSQEMVLHERPLAAFLKGRHRVKFWRAPGGWGTVARVCVRDKVGLQLSAPWPRRLYDWVGIIGQRVGAPSINMPWRQYCSEHAGEILRNLEPDFETRHPSPADIDRWCEARRREGEMEVYGVFDPTL